MEGADGEKPLHVMGSDLAGGAQPTGQQGGSQARLGWGWAQNEDKLMEEPHVGGGDPAGGAQRTQQPGGGRARLG